MSVLNKWIWVDLSENLSRTKSWTNSGNKNKPQHVFSVQSKKKINWLRNSAIHLYIKTCLYALSAINYLSLKNMYFLFCTQIVLFICVIKFGVRCDKIKCSFIYNPTTNIILFKVVNHTNCYALHFLTGITSIMQHNVERV